ncbi:peptidase family M28 [Penicillium waksmanii]|uniref:peptidase family M28 n=1 Tax=Penicillium waksmanii TaxID=69791 RepID=UPI0025465CF6|nr:peptidase family M28 [Penicillium waksmanii]KAJ5999854.1 peptidase family M28 [Penicillium waksmanii]
MHKSLLACFLGAAQLTVAIPDLQRVLAPIPSGSGDAGAGVSRPHGDHTVHESILAAIETHADPVTALVSLQSEDEARAKTEAALAEPRLLRRLGAPNAKAEWMTEGDKMRLRREGVKFMDITDHEEFYKEQVDAMAGKPRLPDLVHERLIRPLFPFVDTERMFGVLEHMTGYYNRYFDDIHGELSSEWLYNHISQIIASSPLHTHISLEYFTHPFRQSSIIARFEPKVRNFKQPLTILGAHQDSANYLFPLLPARAQTMTAPVPSVSSKHSVSSPGLDSFPRMDRLSFTEQGARIGAMMEFDMTAFIATNATESIGFIATEADEVLTNWAVNLSQKYISIPTEVYDLPGNAGSDYMSYTQLNYPASFASEGNPVAGGSFPGEYDP